MQRQQTKMTFSTESSKTVFTMTSGYRVDFTAYAPMHTFKGWSVEGIEASIGIDFNAGTVTHARAVARTEHFDTGDAERNMAMETYIQTGAYPEASVEMTEVKAFTAIGDNRYQVTVLAVLEFMARRRQLPLNFTVALTDDGLAVDLAFKWSFKAYGLKAPRLLFLTVRDIVDISGHGEFKRQTP